MEVILDIEASNLLGPSLDYSRAPYKLKADYSVWCVVCMDIQTKDVYTFVGPDEIRNTLPNFLVGCSKLIGHNIIGFDLPTLMLWAGISYTVGYNGDSMVMGSPCEIIDTLVLSKLLYSDTVNGHSLEDWGRRLGNEKTPFHEWDHFSPEMLEYCIQDTSVNLSMYEKFMEEYRSWKWEKAFHMESKLMDITVGQELYGFKFDKEKAEACVIELDALLAERKAIVDPLLPPKRLNKGEQAAFIPPKVQFKKNGELSSHMLKFVERHSGTVTPAGELEAYGKTWQLPLAVDIPIVTQGIASISDNDHVKGFLLDLGWSPSVWKERDLTIDSKKHKVSRERFEENVKRYVEQTLNGPYKDHRLEIINCTEGMLETLLIGHADLKKPLRVPTSPIVALPPEKELCPGLISLGQRVAFAKDFAEYMTYRHRRNSIAGGVDEEGEPTKGYIVSCREDGRIPTPADTNGTNTGRYMHRSVTNIPRISSLYGEQMRSLFGVSPHKFQLGFDFASLEARIEGHFVYRYTRGPELAATLLMEKPNDLHTKTALRFGITRDAAKSLNYAILYGCQPNKLRKMLGVSEHRAREIYNGFWEEVSSLKELKDNLEKYWEATHKKYILGIDGRKIYTRSKHSLINALFQGAGALAAKYTAVQIAQDLEEQGLWLHPLYHDVENSSGVSQMIVYHDEVAYSVSKDLLKFHVFDSEADAKAYKSDKHLTPVGHGKKWYRAESPLADVISQAISKVVKDLKLRVDLGFEWQVGKNWSIH